MPQYRLKQIAEFNVSSPSTNETLRYDGNFWVNNPEILADAGGTMSVSGNLGIGITTPTANLNVRGRSLFESSSGVDRFIIEDDGRTALSSGVAAATNSLFGHTWKSTDSSYGIIFYPNNATTAGFSLQMQGSTDRGLAIAVQGSPSGTIYGVHSSIFPSSGTTNVGVYGNARNGSSYNIGVDGNIGGGGSVAPSQYTAGVRGQVSYNQDGDSYGGYFEVSPTSGSTVYTNNEYRGVYGNVGGTYDEASSGLTFYGGQFLSNASLSNSTQYGIHSAVNVDASYGTVSAVAGYFSSNAGGTGSTNYAIIVPSGGGDVGIGTSMPDEKLHIVGNMKYIDGNQSSGYLLVSDANGVASWTSSSSIGGDGNGIYDGSGTVPSSATATLNGTFTFGMTAGESVSFSNTNGDSTVNLTSTGGQAILKMNAQTPGNDAYIHFAQAGTNYHTIGIDSSDSNKFKIGAASINTNTVMTIDGSGNLTFESSGDSLLFNTDYTNDNIGIGIDPISSTKLRLRGDGNTSGTTALLVENSGGSDIFNILDDGQSIFNSSGLAGADFTIEGDTDTVLFKTNATENSVGIGIAGTSNIKLYVDATNETRDYIAYFGSNTAQNGINVTTSASDNSAFGAQFNIQTSGTGTTRGAWGNATAGNSVNRYGLYGRAGNASTSNIGVYGLSLFGGGSGINAGVYGVDSGNGDTKHGMYAFVTSGLQDTTTTVYGLRAISQVSLDNVTSYGVHTRLNGGSGATGGVGYSFYAQSSNTPNQTAYGIVIEDTQDYSGFGTTTPTSTLDVSGQFYVEQYTDTVGATSVSIDWDNSNHRSIDLQGASGTVSVSFSNPNAGAWYTIKVVQGTGGHDMIWPSEVLWERGITPSITATDDAIDMIRLYYDGTNYLSHIYQDYS